MSKPKIIIHNHHLDKRRRSRDASPEAADRANKLGWKAALAGKPISSNPFQFSDELKEVWADGWKDGNRDRPHMVKAGDADPMAGKSTEELQTIIRECGVAISRAKESLASRQRRGPQHMWNDSAAMSKGSFVTGSSGKVGKVIESDEDMTLVQWNDGSKARVDTDSLKTARA